MASKRIHQSSVINIDVCCSSMTVIVSQLFVWLLVYVWVTCAQKNQQIHLSFPMLRHLSVTFLTLFSFLFLCAFHSHYQPLTHTINVRWREVLVVASSKMCIICLSSHCLCVVSLQQRSRQWWWEECQCMQSLLSEEIDWWWMCYVVYRIDEWISM